MNRDYSYTSSVAAMLKDLNCLHLDQRGIDNRLVMLYKVALDLFAIPASQYLTRNTRLSRHTHPLSYRQIPTLKDCYRFTFFPKSVIHLEFPAGPYTSPSRLGAVQQRCMSLPKHQLLFLPFNYTNTLFTLYKLSFVGNPSYKRSPP